MKHDHVVISKNGKIGLKEDPNLIISNIIGSIAGRNALAQAMAAPIKRSLDYTGIARRCLVIDPLPTAALPIYDKSIENVSSDNKSTYKHNAISISNKGKIGHKSYSTQIDVPSFEVVSNPTINISDIKQRRFNLIERNNTNSLCLFKHDSVIISKKGKINLKKNHSNGMMNQMVEKIKEDIMAQEDAYIFSILESIGNEK